MAYQNLIPRIFNLFTTEDYLNAAVDTAAWLKEYEIDTPYGKIWRRTPEGDDQVLSQDILFTEKCMYGGSSGIGVFYLRLYEVTGNEEYLQTAEAAASHITATYTGVRSYAEIPQIQRRERPAGWAIGFHNGAAGEAVFLELLYRVVPRQKYLDFIIRVADDYLANAIQEDAGIRWSEASDLSADGGITAFLLLVYRRTKDEKYLRAAIASADYIATKGVDAPEGGKYWVVFDGSKLGFHSGSASPSFTHGTAGAAWILTLLYAETGNEKYRKLAEEAATFLQNIAVGDENGALISNSYHPKTGPDPDKFYLSTCGGPVGTTHLFRQLYESTGNKNYLEWVKRLSRGIIRTGAPERNSWGYWQTACVCCGSSGVLEHFVSVYELTGEKEFLDYAKRTANVILGDAYRIGDKLTWYGAWTRSQPTDVKSYTGLYIGSSGIAATLLRLYAAETGRQISGFFEYLFDK